MDNKLNLIVDAVNLIEENLCTSISIDNVTSNFEFSHWQFQRMFRRISGNSLGEYLRHRRLTESIQDLRDTRLRILDIAIKYEFSSQEAYARAFKKYFHTTPKNVRDTPSLVLPQEKPKLSASQIEFTWKNDVQRVPRIIERSEILLVGRQLDVLNHFIEGTDCVKKVTPHWTNFLGQIKQIPNRIPGELFGAFITSELEMRERDLRYFSGVQVKSFDGLSSDFDTMVLPGGTFACFESVGLVEKTYNVVDYIYGIWLPTSEFKRAPGYDFEHFDKRYNPIDPQSISTFCVPVQSRI